eukprot:COSAG02_NODE_7090_length_3190_cov_22.295697_1_plen_32_part_10
MLAPMLALAFAPIGRAYSSFPIHIHDWILPES